MGRKKSRNAQQATANGPQPGGLMAMAVERLQAGRTKEAVNLAKRAVKASPSDGEAQLILGVAQLALQRPALALSPLRKAVQLIPAEPEAHFQLGLCLRQLGETNAAAEALSQCLALRPDFAPGYQQLGFLLAEEGLFDQAEQALLLACQFDPQDAESAFRLGIIADQKGDQKAAIERYSQAIAANPRLTGAYINLGNIALDNGKLELAASTYRQAIDSDPRSAMAHSNLGRVLKELELLSEAEQHCRKAVELDPKLAEGWNNLGNVYKCHERFAETPAYYEKAIALSPKVGAYYFNLADVWDVLGDYEKAEKLYRKAVELQPDLSEAYNNFATMLASNGDLEQARANFEKALEHSPGHHGYRSSLGGCLRRMGQIHGDLELFRQSFEYGESDFISGLRQPHRRFNIPLWRGEDLKGKRLLIWREQGVGDELEFSQLYQAAIDKAAADKAVQVVIEADERLVPLFARNFPTASVKAEDFTGDAAREDADCHIPAGDLRAHFMTVISGDVPQRPSGPFLVPDPSLLAKWRERLAPRPRELRIGFCWRSGLAGRQRDQNYSQLLDWEALFALPDVQWVNLQYGDCEDEIREAEAKFGVEIIRWDDLDLKQNLEDVTALTAELDLVITAPTSVMQIARAIGTPVWSLHFGSLWPNIEPGYNAQDMTTHWFRHQSESWEKIIDRVAAILAPLVSDANLDHKALTWMQRQQQLVPGHQRTWLEPLGKNALPSTPLSALIPTAEAWDPRGVGYTMESRARNGAMLLKERDRVVLAKLVGGMAPQVAVEIGTGQGHSARILRDNAPQAARIVSVDLLETDREGNFAESCPNSLTFASLCRDENGKPTVELVARGIDTVDFEGAANLRGQVDLMFIDGLLNIKAAEADYRLMRALLAPQGIAVWRGDFDYLPAVGYAYAWLYNQFLGRKEFEWAHIQDSGLILARPVSESAVSNGCRAFGDPSGPFPDIVDLWLDRE